jgi:hypothetical protein
MGVTQSATRSPFAQLIDGLWLIWDSIVLTTVRDDNGQYLHNYVMCIFDVASPSLNISQPLILRSL